jgi:hypothetical protein
VPAHLCSDPNISDRAVRLFAILYLYSFRYEQVTPSRRTLADAMGCSLPSLDKAKAELVELGVLSVERRQTDDVENLTNVYTLLIDPIGGGQNPFPPSQKNVARGSQKNAPVKPTRSYLQEGSVSVSPPEVGSPEAETWCDVCGVRGGKHRYDCEAAA